MWQGHVMLGLLASLPSIGIDIKQFTEVASWVQFVACGSGVHFFLL